MERVNINLGLSGVVDVDTPEDVESVMIEKNYLCGIAFDLGQVNYATNFIHLFHSMKTNIPFYTEYSTLFKICITFSK